MSIEAMKQALEAIANSGDFLFNWHDCEPNNEREMSRYQDVLAMNEKAFNTLRTSIEQAEKQEPVAWMENESFVDADNLWDVRVTFNQNGNGIPLYTTPPAGPVQEPYTYASTQATKCACCGEHKHTPLRIDAMNGYVCLTCIDQKLGSLLGEFGYPSTAPVQEPDWQARLTELQTVFKDVDQSGPLLGMGRPPAAQRQWVGLDESEITQEVGDSQVLRDVARAIEAKLRSKNGGDK